MKWGDQLRIVDGSVGMEDELLAWRRGMQVGNC